MSKTVNGLFEEVYIEIKKPISIGGNHLSLLGETSRRQCGSLVKIGYMLNISSSALPFPSVLRKYSTFAYIAL